MRLVRYLVILFVCICLMGCSNEKKEIKEQAQNEVSILKSGDMENINDLIFGKSESGVIDQIEVLLDEKEDSESKGILGEIFQRVSIKVVKVKENVIEYEIKAPNLSDMFNELLHKGEKFSESEFLEYMKNYVNSAELKKSRVLVNYKVEEGNIIVDYKSKEFIDAITGGLLSSYQQLYGEILEEYINEMEDGK